MSCFGNCIPKKLFGSCVETNQANSIKYEIRPQTDLENKEIVLSRKIDRTFERNQKVMKEKYSKDYKNQ